VIRPSLLATLATVLIDHGFCQTPKASPAGVDPARQAAIAEIEQAIGGRYISESQSIDKKSVRWEFLDGACHGLPVIVDVVAYPTIDLARAAAVAAFSQADYDWTWLVPKDKKLTGKEPVAETTEQYLARQAAENKANGKPDDEKVDHFLMWKKAEEAKHVGE
jgi:hypothetical protein